MKRLLHGWEAQWSESRFIQFERLVINAGVRLGTEPLLSENPEFRYHDKNGYSMVMDSIREEVSEYPGHSITRKLDPNDFTVDGHPLTYVSCEFAGHVVDQMVPCVSVAKFGTPDTPAALREVTVETFKHSVPEIGRSGSNAYLVIDVSKLLPPPDSILHEFRIKFPSVTTVQEYELVGTRTINAPLTKVVLNVMTTT